MHPADLLASLRDQVEHYRQKLREAERANSPNARRWRLEVLDIERRIAAAEAAHLEGQAA
jgi:hypothetical protein